MRPKTEAAGRRPAPNIRAPADGLGSAKLLPQETTRRPKADAAGRRPAPNIRAPADGLGSAKPLPQETVRAPRSGDPRFVRINCDARRPSGLDKEKCKFTVHPRIGFSTSKKVKEINKKVKDFNIKKSN